MLVYILVRQAR